VTYGNTREETRLGFNQNKIMVLHNIWENGYKPSRKIKRGAGRPDFEISHD